MQYATPIDVESIRWRRATNEDFSIPFAIAWRTFGRNPHEYTSGGRRRPLVHAPLHKFESHLYIVDEFFKNEEIAAYVKKSDAWSSKILDFFIHAPASCKRAPLSVILKELCDTAKGPIMAHCIDSDLESIWNGDRIFKTGIFPNGPHFRSPYLPGWNSLTFVCTRKAFTDPSLNEKFLKKYPHLIDTSLEALTIAYRGNIHQSHRPDEDVELLIDLLDHVYTHVSKQDFWNLLRATHDHYDCKPVTVHRPGNIRFDTIQASGQCS